ncbi:cytochrome c oxidase subunit 3 [Marinilongibacter aquaticus]|uniref:cytochrome c oxidase subunit 3 n=1 Tax=Marinilongibacter aquaticus TaxID=2975157 RepID=UPI0021BD5D83|nr:cytochrome c oxidase subunit 3 [Marinilongibacter aquaticus]UBM57272.1 cytochrome c oxidase subunit 3 [Marinilongibacter aquaticus]
MATTHASSTPEHLIWKGGVQPMKVGYGKLMMWIFLLSDTFTFSALLISYGLIRFSYPSFLDVHPGQMIHDFVPSEHWWPIPEFVFEAVPFLHGVTAPLVFVGIMTFILIFSSVTMVLAVEAGHRRDKADVEKWMLWTILGGFTFLGSQAWEWSHFIHGTGLGGANLVHNEYGPPAFADFFFFITGFHGTHVFSGVVLNIMIFYNTVNGVYEKRGHYEMIEKVGLYWHFVDLVWVFVFTFFYLV